MTTLSTLPLYAPAGRDTQVVFALTESGSNFVRVWITNAPPGSELRQQIDESAQNRVKFYEGDGGSDNPERRRFDVGGRYTFVAQEYARGASSYGGGYQRSPDGATSETKVGTEVTLSLFIGQRMTSPISVGADTLTVVLWVWDETIRTTSIAVHGEATPAIEATTPSPRAQAVVESAAVQGALSGLRDQVVATAVGTAGAVLADFVPKWNAHLGQSGVHDADDSFNGIPVGLASASSASSLADSITEILPLIRYHYLNDAVKGGVTAGRDTAGYHDVSGKKNDNGNLPIVAGASQLVDSYWATADLWRSYEAHRVSTAVHDGADTTNALATLPLLLQVGAEVFTVLAATSPAVPETQSAGAMTLIGRAGFSETPL